MPASHSDNQMRDKDMTLLESFWDAFGVRFVSCLMEGELSSVKPLLKSIDAGLHEEDERNNSRVCQ